MALRLNVLESASMVPVLLSVPLTRIVEVPFQWFPDRPGVLDLGLAAGGVVDSGIRLDPV